LEDNLGSEQESDNGLINSEILQERQFKADMERYDFVIARARAIVERRRQEELEDNDIPVVEGGDGNGSGNGDGSGDSNSDEHNELSVLASSQFNGIDGVEYGGIGGIEISGSIELDSGSDDDSTSALDIAFSPRKMRSGKVR
jgi:hypothetical protein